MKLEDAIITITEYSQWRLGLIEELIYTPTEITKALYKLIDNAEKNV